MAKVNHTNRKHAMLSASGAARWLNCTPSARLEEKFASKSSIYAEEGTLAHEYSDIELQFYFGLITKKVYTTELKKIKKHALYTPEMDAEVAKYTSIVIETYKAAKAINEHAVILLEQKLDFSHLVENGFGTGDAVIISDGTLEVIDLKYGKGIKVEALENPQLKLYGLGALREYELLYDINKVKLTIVQPRLDNYSTQTINVHDLTAWGTDIVKPRAEYAYAGEGEQMAGSWCKFCKAKAVCRAFAKKNLELARFEFQDPLLLEDADLLDIYKQLDTFQDWVSAIKSHFLDTALKGKHWPGYKLVEGRSNRKWLDESEVIKTLKKENFEEDKFIISKLAGITAIEKLVGKTKFTSLLNDYVVKPQGAPTLVDESDKRPAFGIEQAKIDFAKK